MLTPEPPADPDGKSTQSEVSLDGTVREAILQWPMSATPRTLEQNVRQRVRQRRRTRQLRLAGLSFGILCLAGFLTWQPWRGSPPEQMTRTGRDTETETSPLKLAASDLHALFALPPVENLTVLDRRQSIAFEAMQQWEEHR